MQLFILPIACVMLLGSPNSASILTRPQRSENETRNSQNGSFTGNTTDTILLDEAHVENVTARVEGYDSKTTDQSHADFFHYDDVGTTVTPDMNEKGNTTKKWNIRANSGTAPTDHISPVDISGETQTTENKKSEYYDHTDSDYYPNDNDIHKGDEGHDHSAYPIMPTFYTCGNYTCPEKATCRQEGFFVYCDCPPDKTGPKCEIDNPCSEQTDDCPVGMKCYGPCNPNVFCEGAMGIPHCTTCLEGWIGDKCDQDENECTAYPDICENGGVCQNSIGHFECLCTLGWTGDYCELQVDSDTNKDGESKKDETEDEIYENITPVDDSNEMQKTDTNKAEYHDHTDRTYTSDYYEVYTEGKGPDHSAYPIMPTFYTCENFTCPEKATCIKEGFLVYCDCPPDKAGPKCELDNPCSEQTDDCPVGMTCYGPCNPNVFCEGATGIPHCTTCLEGWIGDKCDKDENECTAYPDICENGGVCQNSIGHFECLCTHGWTGDYCESKVDFKHGSFTGNTTDTILLDEAHVENVTARVEGYDSKTTDQSHADFFHYDDVGTTVTPDMNEKGNTTKKWNIRANSGTAPTDHISPVDISGETQTTENKKSEYYDHTDSDYYPNDNDIHKGDEGHDHSAYPIMPTFYTCENFTCPEKATCIQEGFFVYCDCPPDKTGPKCELDNPCSEQTDDCPVGMTCYGPCNPNVFCEGATGIPHCTTCLEGWIGDKCDKDENECTAYPDICENGGVCQNSIGHFECLCTHGWTGDYCESKVDSHTYTDRDSKKDETDDTVEPAESKHSRACASAFSTSMVLSAFVGCRILIM
ncbi:neurogenic locus notch homolog protein 3-like isoform X2 [Mya arenaria]|uniref:neurogenic locus notch homolog protein 3-like isoform X2 n=1 Tax=Mya arenaria TaxID=6604 RepID=UPI0022E73393|nr:neurogenic locus notch homolog protein 3-like isoform X2 [Mya arenaria]